MNLDALHAHQEEHHKIATDALRFFARQADVPYPIVRDLFIEGHPDTTMIFWLEVNQKHPGRFVGVSWCACCRRFNLQERTH